MPLIIGHFKSSSSYRAFVYDQVGYAKSFGTNQASCTRRGLKLLNLVGLIFSLRFLEFILCENVHRLRCQSGLRLLIRHRL